MPWKSFWFGIKYAIVFQIMYWLMAADRLWNGGVADNFTLYCLFAGISFVLTCGSIAYLHNQREKQLVSDRSGEV